MEETSLELSFRLRKWRSYRYLQQTLHPAWYAESWIGVPFGLAGLNILEQVGIMKVKVRVSVQPSLDRTCTSSGLASGMMSPKTIPVMTVAR